MSHTGLPLPDGYGALLEELKRTVAESRWRAQRVVNTELVRMYWRIGHTICTRQHAEGWGTRVIGRLSEDLRQAFPQMRRLSQRNLAYMQTFAGAWPREIAQQAVAQLPWGHITVLLDLRDPVKHAPTVGILLCAGRNDNVVRYSLAGSNQPLAVADHTYDTLPAAVRAAVPSEEELEKAADTTFHDLADDAAEDKEQQ